MTRIFVLILSMLTCTAACAVDPVGRPEPSTSEQALVDRMSDVLGGAETNIGCGFDCNEGEGLFCCRIIQGSMCCGGVDQDGTWCTCSPLPHTDPGHGIPREPFAPVSGDEQ